jgi:arabinan endo-1,5-alpha-L-arabinosidase
MDCSRARVRRRWRILLMSVATVLATVSLVGCSAVSPRLSVSGDLAAHDPDLVVGQHGAPWYVYSTGDESIGGGNIEIRTSSDGHDWKLIGTVWKRMPGWINQSIRGVSNLWAPDLFHRDGTWYLYYAASTFGSNNSVIALATNTTLDPHSANYRWVDRGAVIESHTTDNFNAIDPTVVEDASGVGWMAFGSFWGGIQLVKLSFPSGKLAAATSPQQIAYRGSPPDAIEGSTIIRHGDAYFLIVSRDLCCRGIGSTYNMAVGRSASVQGPYLDEKGHPLVDDGGTPLLASKGNQIGPGGESYSDGYLAWHYYDGNAGGATTLAIQKLGWTTDGWPTLQQN